MDCPSTKGGARPPGCFRPLAVHKSKLISFFGVVCVAALWIAGCASSRMEAPARGPLHPTLNRTVMVGYQGWFRTPGDGTGLNWTHYLQGRRDDFSPGHLVIDFWPDVSELGPDEKFATPLKHPDGGTAYVFSSHHPQTVDRHFRWMQDYGIDGAFVQRFAAPIIAADEPARLRLRAVDDVLRYARAGAERHGRSFVVMYDLSGLAAGKIEGVMRDWRHLVDDLRIRDSAAYQYHRDKPLVAVWGIGFNDGRAYTLAETGQLIEFLKNDPVYGGNTVMLGIPTWWRQQTDDAVRDPRLHEVLAKADILSPWTPGRYSDLAGVRLHAERCWGPDRAWCGQHGLDYLPVVFPGFSWRNLKNVDNGIDRADGRFLWEQYRLLLNSGNSMIYQAMFDEMNEGTQIFKTSNHPPPGHRFLTYAPLPPDYYLWLVGTAAGFAHDGRSLPDRIVPHPSAEVTRYLRAGDDMAYAAAQNSFETRKSLLTIHQALNGHGLDWAGIGPDGARVRAAGKWAARHTWSVDPAASMAWELPVPGAGEFELSIRYPGGLPNQPAARARLRVWQGETLRGEATVNQRENMWRWNVQVRVVLAPGLPCRVELDQPTATGALAAFEPRLTAAK